MQSPAERAFRDVALLGPFFTLHLPGEAPDDVDWQPFGAGFDSLLAARITELGAQFAATERRPIASILHLGGASALTAPLLATAATQGLVPALAPEDLLLGFRDGGPLQVALVRVPGGKPALLPELAGQLLDVTGELLGAFTKAVTDQVPLPEKTLQGNVFSALAAAARLITAMDAGARARALVDLIARRSFAGAGTLNWRDTDPVTYFRRRNCCLFYRIPGAGICGDCILTP